MRSYIDIQLVGFHTGHMPEDIIKFIEENLLSTKQLSEYTGLKEVTLRRRYVKGTIKGMKIGGTCLFYKPDFKPNMKRWQHG